MKERPNLESRFKECVREAVKYVSTIEDFDNLVDPRTLARHYLGLEPSLYVLNAIDWERKEVWVTLTLGKLNVLSFFRLIFLTLTLIFLSIEMTTKFN